MCIPCMQCVCVLRMCMGMLCVSYCVSHVHAMCMTCNVYSLCMSCVLQGYAIRMYFVCIPCECHVYPRPCICHGYYMCIPCECLVSMPCICHLQCVQVCLMGMPSCCFTFTRDRETAAGHAQYHVQWPCPAPCPLQCPIQVPCHLYDMGTYYMCVPCECHVYAIGITCVYHVNAMCNHCHVYAMGITCVFHANAMCLPCVCNM